MTTLTRSSWLNNLRADYFKSRRDSIISVLCLILIAVLLYKFVDWAFLNSVWTSTETEGAEACRNISGACWAVIEQRGRLILFGLYPQEEQWRSSLACVVIIVVGILSCLPFFWSGLRLSLLWLIGFATFYILMRGGIFGLKPVLEDQWGGLALTVFVFSTVAIIGMPLAVCLALLRQSKLPVISYGVALLIDTVRSLPLLAIMFTAAVILPLVLPDWVMTDKLYRVILGYSLFFAAYQAEIIRGGMQAIPAGQDEAAKALGLNYWQRTSRVLLPQAFRNALPPTINQFVITFQETSLIVIVGFFDVLASGNAAFSGAGWQGHYVEVYFFVALIFFVFVFSLSRYGAYLESRLRVGQH